MKISVILMFALVLMSGCKDSATEAIPIPDAASGFVYEGSVGTVYTLRKSVTTTDTNSKDTSYVVGDLLIRILNRSMQLPSGKNALAYELSDNFSRPGTTERDTVYLIANEQELRYTKSLIDTVTNLILTQPFQTGAKFKQRATDNDASKTEIIEVNTQISVPAGSYNIIKTRNFGYVDTLSAIKYVDVAYDSYAKGVFLVRNERIQTTTKASGKKTIVTTRFELVSVTKP